MNISSNNKSSENLLSIIYHHILDSEAYFTLFYLDVTKHVILLWISCFLIFLYLYYVSKKVNNTKLFSTVDVLIVFIRENILNKNISDKDIREWLPFFVSLFLFILTSNLLGLIPFSSTITGNLSVNIVLASFILFLIIFYGIKKKGILGYFSTLVPSGIPSVLYPFLFFIEIISLLSKPLPLAIRLFANMIGGHIIIIVFLYFIINSANSYSQWIIAPLSIFTVVILSLFEVFVSFLQAYIFTLLAAIFIGLSADDH